MNPEIHRNCKSQRPSYLLARFGEVNESESGKFQSTGGPAAGLSAETEFNKGNRTEHC